VLPCHSDVRCFTSLSRVRYSTVSEMYAGRKVTGRGPEWAGPALPPTNFGPDRR